MQGVITGILAARHVETFPVPSAQYFTTPGYPILVDLDALTVSPISVTSGALWQPPVDDIQVSVPQPISGALAATIVYQSYNNWAEELLQVGPPQPLSGTIVATIAYVNYNNWAEELLQVGPPQPLSGTIATTAAYVNYNNWAEELLEVSVPSPISGALT